MATVVVATHTTREKSGPNTTLLVVAAGVLAVLILLDAIIASFKDSSLEARRTRELGYQRILSEVFFRLEELTSIPCPHLGAHIFVKKWRVRPREVLARRSPVAREMVRVHRFRINVIPAPNNVLWRTGKGAIALAETSQDFETHDVQSWEAGLAGDSLTEFEERPSADRLGLSHREFRALYERYSAIAAVPIFSSTNVIGILAVDVNYDGGHALLKRKAVKTLLVSSAAQVAVVLEG